MIILEDVTKIVSSAKGDGAKKRAVLTAVQASLPSDQRIAVLGAANEDKRIFIHLLAGLMLPTTGRIIRHAKVSFPAGHLGGFSKDLSVRLNVAHVARLYGAEVDPIVDFVAQVCRLGEAFNKPFGDLSNTAKREFSQVLAFSVPFDVYLLSEDAVQPSNKEARALFEARAKTSGMIISSEDPGFVREFCTMGLVLNEGQLRLFQDVERALAFSQKAQAPSLKERQERHKARKKRKRKDKLATPDE